MDKTGLVVTSFGRQFVVEVDGVSYQAVTKAKKTDYVVGDMVQVQLINQEQLQIVELIPRHNLVYRIDHNRSKIIASNIDQLLIVIAVKPYFDSDFLNNCLTFAESSKIKPIIVINKSDLLESAEFIQQIEDLYAKMLLYPVIQLSALDNCRPLIKFLNDKSNLLIGQSGVGKSTITNQLITTANTRTGSLGKLERSGCHTTTNATLYHIDKTTTITDCPGLQGFGLYDLPLEGIISFFPEFRSYLGQCKFNNCRHLTEPGCALIIAAKQGLFVETRFNYLQRLTQSLLTT
jgi:ribosome biogenesis GTPase